MYNTIMLKMLDNAVLGHEDAIKWVVENVRGIFDEMIRLAEEAEDMAADPRYYRDKIADLEEELDTRASEIEDLEEEIGTLERAIITLEEELNEARQALDEALNESPQG